MSERPYELAHVDGLDRIPADDEGLTWRPIRRRFDIRAFGVNAYTAEHAGQRVVEEHREAQNGHEELYFVANGRATFTLEAETHDAPAGTLVFVRPGTLRGAVAAEPGTTVLAIGGRPGAVFEPSGWETAFMAVGLGRLGRADEGIALLRQAIEQDPRAWQGHYNLACLLALEGRRDEALDALERAHETAPEGVAGWAAEDPDFASVREDPRFLAIAGEAGFGGEPA